MPDCPDTDITLAPKIGHPHPTDLFDSGQISTECNRSQGDLVKNGDIRRGVALRRFFFENWRSCVEISLLAWRHGDR
jgi:hypothetical protein